MITFLRGILAETSPTHVVVDIQGVGYTVYISVSSYDRLPGLGAEVLLRTHHHVIPRDGSQHLFGFVTKEEHEMFLHLISVSGIGPRLALNILSGSSIDILRNSIVEGNASSLSALPGIGKKTAERIVVELRDKFAKDSEFESRTGIYTTADQKLRDAVLALVSLGFKQAEAQKSVLSTVQSLDPKATVEEVVRTALRKP